MEKKKKNRTILSSTFARIVAFFILAISFITGVGGSILSAMLWEEDAYMSGMKPLIHDVMSHQVWTDVNYVKTLFQEGDIEGIEAYLGGKNATMEIYDSDVPEGEKTILLWSNYDGTETEYSFNCFTSMRYTLEAEVSSETSSENQEEAMYDVTQVSVMDDEELLENEMVIEVETDYYPTEVEIATEYVWKETLFRVYVDDSFPIEDEYSFIHNWGMAFSDWIYVIPVVAIISVFLFLSSFIYLMCSAGHHKGKEGISGGVLYFFHFDVITVIFGLLAIMGFVLICDLISWGDGFSQIIGCVLLVAEVIWCTIYFMEFATELKMGTLFRHTLVYAILSKCGKGLKALWRINVSLIKGLPLVTNVMLVYIGFSIVQFIVLLFFCALWSMDGEVLVLCLLEKVVLLPVVIYFALVCKKLQQGSEALAEGNLTYKLDTSKMILGFKDHGENLNRIGEGISVAVDERMKSEHLKTELITNVSHDLKTPLTSIINYADLIGTAVNSGAMSVGTDSDGSSVDDLMVDSTDINRTQLAEYSEVLLRQSKRLKKLLEDLVEASKATTGNLEVNLAPCETSVILSQAIGEYEQRFAEKQLELIVKQPEEPVNIQADGRHLWRVFDNLLNNICKYAQENTRVYLTVEPKENNVEIVFRNMSKYALDVSGEELQERFVRGDKSRHMEGNGLGLSIAGSLVELQNGSMEIITDGDLFKVVLRFPMIQNGKV